MNVVDVAREVNVIRDLARAGDHEAARSKERQLYQEVIFEVANDHPDARSLARRAMETEKISFGPGRG